jgi:histidine triad (HIT) family protein
MHDNPCPFCAIVAGAAPAHRLYEDDAVLAFMDIRPIRPGHVLVIPKAHVPEFQMLDDASYVAVMLAGKRIAEAVALAVRPLRVGLAIAGFDVPHTHVHVVPMHDYHDLTSKRLLDGQVERAAPEELAAMAGRLRDVLGPHPYPSPTRGGDARREVSRWARW